MSEGRADCFVNRPRSRADWRAGLGFAAVGGAGRKCQAATVAAPSNRPVATSKNLVDQLQLGRGRGLPSMETVMEAKLSQ